MTNLDSIFKSRDIILVTKVHVINAMVFQVGIYGGGFVAQSCLTLATHGP